MTVQAKAEEERRQAAQEIQMEGRGSQPGEVLIYASLYVYVCVYIIVTV